MAEAFTLDADYLARKRAEVKDGIAYARYGTGSDTGTWYQAAIQSAVVLDNGTIEVTFLIDHTVLNNLYVSAIELFDWNGHRIGSINAHITASQPGEDILYAVWIDLFQVSENAGGTGAYDAI